MMLTGRGIVHRSDVDVLTNKTEHDDQTFEHGLQRRVHDNLIWHYEALLELNAVTFQTYGMHVEMFDNR